MSYANTWGITNYKGTKADTWFLCLSLSVLTTVEENKVRGMQQAHVSQNLVDNSNDFLFYPECNDLKNVDIICSQTNL